MSETAQGHAELVEVPQFHPVAARKLQSLLADGWSVNGYAIMKGEDRRGFVDFGGFVGWWLPEYYAGHTSDATPRPEASDAPDIVDIIERLEKGVRPEGGMTMEVLDRVYSHPSSPDFQKAASEAIRRA